MQGLRSKLTSFSYGARKLGLNLIGVVALTFFAVAPVSAETVIAALGDSLTQGYGLIQEEGFVPQLETWLATHGEDVRLINAGVSGDTTARAQARLLSYLQKRLH